MEFGRQVIEKLQRKKKMPSTSPLTSQGLQVQFYLPDTHQIIHLKGSLSAEELCIEAAKKLGVSPLCSTLFALYAEDKNTWYSPNHVFVIDETTRLKLHYRMRFYFINWHGTDKDSLPILRHALKRSSNQETAVLDLPSLTYLYAQSQYDFQSGLAPLRSPQSEEDARQIENECLGMAVMAISHDAMCRNLHTRELAKKFKYKNYIPLSFKQDISQRNIFTRLRIANVFKAFLEEFSDRTIKSNSVSKHYLKVKYISTLENLTQGFGREVFEPSSLVIHESEDDISALRDKDGARHRVLVSGTCGIKWQKVPVETCPDPWSSKQRRMSKRSKRQQSEQNEDPKHPTKDDGWTTFSNFHEITHIVIRDSAVTVYKQDDKRMELHLAAREEALSFVSLIDGYFRLTVDAHHFLCTDVAPVSVQENLSEGCHGPISTEYAIHKLKQEGYEEGMYILRWSCADYDHVLLTVICKEMDGSGGIVKTFKNLQIEKLEGRFRLCGTDTEKPTLRELTDQLSGHRLSTESTILTLNRGRPPQPREASNLLMATQTNAAAPPTHKHLIIPRINKEDIIQDKHLGKGTRTNIFSARLKLRSDDDEGLAGFQRIDEVKVVLKVLGAGHKDISAFLETVSLMRQITHKHMALLYGICMHSMDIIMVEEFVQHGPLDLFMRAHHTTLTPSWKFQVAEQLASVLSYLEDTKLVHGFVCTKNILLAKVGLEGQGAPFIKLSDPGVPITMLSREECIDRIPWIAPECVKNPKALSVAVDKWGFGTTLWEICHNGEVPLRDKQRTEKERFYEAEGTLVIPNSSELADLITQCMNYDPRKRPFFRAIVRELDHIKEQNPSVVSGVIPLQETDSSVFESRFLQTIRKLGEGHFGKVELCMYDPHGDQTGQYVAVKSLKSERDGSETSNLRREINTMRELYHKNIVKYKGICNEEGGRTIKLIMEYLPAGSLKEYLPKNKANISEDRLLLYALQICQGMDYLGSQNYIHRDLAARNVLVKSETLVKIGDFGLTKSIKDNENYYTVREDQDSPVYWYAPECLIHRKFYKASDVWSFGVTLYELMTYCDRKSNPPDMFLNITGRSHGQMTMARLVQALEKGKRLPCPPSCPDVVYTQMRRCWAYSPEDRVDFKSLIEVFERLLSAEELSLAHSC
ncbi:tyrosine-protein kinase JAK1-like [Salminus brasiliensis]|uniref:tyrosine-protein kinase JAK1-like n=1 Tax=Salminus brasiliensis TaxID=930266 RepID=UPI003B832846